MDNEFIKWIFGIAITLIFGLISYIWHENRREIREMKKRILSLETNYREEFALVHANITNTKEAIIDRINKLQVDTLEKYISKDECAEYRRLREL